MLGSNPKFANQLWHQQPTSCVDACGTTLRGSGLLIPDDDRSNYEKGGAEELVGGTLQFEITQKATQRGGGLSVPNRGL